MIRATTLALAMVLALAGGATAAEPDPELAPLNTRMQAIDLDPGLAGYAAYERLQARNALAAAAQAKRRDRPHAVTLARLRVESAELAVSAERAREQAREFEDQRRMLLVEESRRDAERARAEAERMRIEAQIQAEEAERLRAAIEAESVARADAEATLDTVAASEAERLRRAKAREAELARQEAALRAGQPAAPKPKPKPKPRSGG